MAARPAKRAIGPSSSSIRSSWLYFAMRSVREAEPAPLKMTPLDKKFLRSLKITVDEEEG